MDISNAQSFSNNEQSITKNQIKQTADWLFSKRRHYETSTSDLSTEDLHKIQELANNPSLALSVIDELIALAEVREPPLGTTEFFHAGSVSPVVRVLARIGKPALPKIDQALTKKNLPIWSHLALKDARRLINSEGTDFNEVIYSDNVLVLPREAREKMLAKDGVVYLGLGYTEIKYTQDSPLLPKSESKKVSESRNVAQSQDTNLNKKMKFQISSSAWIGAIFSLLAVFFFFLRRSKNEK